jgi:hypothetical protein
MIHISTENCDIKIVLVFAKAYIFQTTVVITLLVLNQT